MKANPKYPLKEYENAGKEPVYCLLGGHSFVVPLSYHGDKEAFVKDLLNNDEVSETAKPSDYIDIDGYKILPPQKWQGKLTPQIKNRMIDLAVVKYNSAVRLAKIHKYIDEKSQLTLNDKKVEEQFDAIINSLGKKGENTLEAFNQFITNASERLSRNTLNVGAKIVTAPLLFTAMAVGKNSETGKALTKAAKIVVENVWQNSFVDEEKSKKAADNLNKFLDTACSKFIKTTIPVITKMAKVADKVYKYSTTEIKNAVGEHKKRTTLGFMLGLAGIGGGGFSLRGQSSENDTDKKVPQTEIVVAPEHEAIQTKFYTISDVNSLEKALKETEPLIHRILLPTEFFCENGYPDNNDKDPNTIGTGLYFCPDNLNPNNKGEGIRVKQYLKNASQNDKITLTYAEAMDLTMWWGTVRGNSRIIKTMADNLKGCTLTQSQLAAIYSVYYNSEASGLKLCQHIQKNPNESPIETAAFITTLQPEPSNGTFDKGIFKRHCHEALVYLNYNDFCNKILDFKIRSGYKTNKSGAQRFFHESPVYERSVKKYSGFIDELNNGILGYETSKLINEMLSYNPVPKKGCPVTSVKNFIVNNTSGDTKTAMLDDSHLTDYHDVTKQQTAKNIASIIFHGVTDNRERA